MQKRDRRGNQSIVIIVIPPGIILILVIPPGIILMPVIPGIIIIILPALVIQSTNVCKYPIDVVV